MEFSSNSQTISWFADRQREGNLKLAPPYQRRPVWAAKQKCYLIESILAGYPVPEICLQLRTDPEGKTRYDIVDGQQRIRAVLQFIGLEIDPKEADSNKFVLDKLAAGSSWQGKSFADLTDTQKQKFYAYKFSVRELNAVSDDEVRDMFARLNRYLTPLKPQELRNATYTGPFAALACKLADDEYWSENRIVTPAAIRRMADIEFASELVIAAMHGPQSGSADAIDEYYRKYEDYDDEFPGQKKAYRLFLEALQTVKALLPEIKDTRWGNKTDFYTLFGVTAHLLRDGNVLGGHRQRKLRRALDEFAKAVERRISEDAQDVSEEAKKYAAAVEKGANDKARRVERHAALLKIMTGCLAPASGSSQVVQPATHPSPSPSSSSLKRGTPLRATP